jgi:cytoskeletal protein CcmA (bactofilin family)
VIGGNIQTAGQITATGNITTAANIAGGNLSITGAFSPSTVTATGNVAGGNLTTAGQISASGNITTAGFFVGNFAGNITGNLTVPGSNTQVLFNNNGNAGATAGLTFATDGPNLLTVAGNTQSGNLRTTGLVSAAGNVNAGNIVTSGAVSATGNVSATANVLGGNVISSAVVSVPVGECVRQCHWWQFNYSRCM